MILDIPTLYNLKNLRVKVTLDNAAVAKAKTSLFNTAAAKMADQLNEAAHTYGVDIPANEVNVRQVGEDQPFDTVDYGAWWSPPESPIELVGGQKDGEVLEVRPGTDRITFAAGPTLPVHVDEDSPIAPATIQHFDYEYCGFNTETRRRVFRLRP